MLPPTNPSSSTSQAAAPAHDFYDQLQSVVANVPSRDMVLVLGDFNARVGSDLQSWGSVIGPHSMGDCNSWIFVPITSLVQAQAHPQSYLVPEWQSL